MRYCPPQLALPLLALLAMGCPSAVGAESMRLTIGKDVYEVPVGDSFAVKINNERITMRIDPQANREFVQSGVSFVYPTALELDENSQDKSVTIWTLQGKNVAVMLQRYASGITPDSLSEVLVENITEQYKEKKVAKSAVKLRGTERSYEGVQLKTVNQGVHVVQNLFTFENEAGVFALMVQDAHPTGEKESKEYAEVLRLLGESLKTGKPPEPPASELPVTEEEAAAAKRAQEKEGEKKPPTKARDTE